MRLEGTVPTFVPLLASHDATPGLQMARKCEMIESAMEARIGNIAPEATEDARGTDSMAAGLVCEVPFADFAGMLGARALLPGAPVNDVVETDPWLMESFLRLAAKYAPVNFSAEITGQVEFRAGEGPLSGIRTGQVQVEANWADAVLSWSGDNGHENAALPLNIFSLYVVRRDIVPCK